MKRMIKSILFDFDGTLVDSEHFHFTSWNIALEEYGHQVDYNYYNDHFAGVPATENVKNVIELFSLSVSPSDLLAKGEAITESRLGEHDIVFMPYAPEVIQSFYGMGLPMAIVTGSPRRDVDDTLGKVDIGKYFQHIVTRDDVVKSKPDPESYLKAISYFGLNPESFLVFEDTITGATSAKRAGLTCIGVQQNQKTKGALSEIADYTFNDLNEAKLFVLEEFDFDT